MQQARSKLEWKKFVEALDESGQTVRDFAADRGLNPTTLGWWRSACRRESAGAPTRTRSTAHRPRPSEPHFMPVVIESPLKDATLEAVLPNGIVVRATGIAPAAFIAGLAALR